MASILDELVAGQLFAWLLIFARTGTAMMLLPGFGDAFVNPRVRLLLGLAIAALVTPALAPQMPAMPAQPSALAALVAGEFAVGALLGLVARMLVTALTVAGTIASFQLSLSSAVAFNPSVAGSDTLPSSFLTILGAVLIFATDLHHLMLSAVIDSYHLFPAGVMPPFGDAVDLLTRMLSQSFLIGLQFTAPLIVLGMGYYLALGLMARLMPQVQVFFVAAPLQVLLGFVVFGLTLSTAMLHWLRHFEDGMRSVLVN